MAIVKASNGVKCYDPTGEELDVVDKFISGKSVQQIFRELNGPKPTFPNKKKGDDELDEDEDDEDNW